MGNLTELYHLVITSMLRQEQMWQILQMPLNNLPIYVTPNKYFIYLYVTLLFSDKYSLLGPKPMFTPHFTKLLSRRKGWAASAETL